MALIDKKERRVIRALKRVSEHLYRPVSRSDQNTVSPSPIKQKKFINTNDEMVFHKRHKSMTPSA